MFLVESELSIIRSSTALSLSSAGWLAVPEGSAHSKLIHLTLSAEDRSDREQGISAQPPPARASDRHPAGRLSAMTCEEGGERARVRTVGTQAHSGPAQRGLLGVERDPGKGLCVSAVLIPGWCWGSEAGKAGRASRKRRVLAWDSNMRLPCVASHARACQRVKSQASWPGGVVSDIPRVSVVTQTPLWARLPDMPCLLGTPLALRAS